MPASNTFVKRTLLQNGILMEEGTFTSSGGTTTHTITADTTDTNNPKMNRILWSELRSTGGTPITPVDDATLDKDQLKLNFTANDDGTYRLFGLGA